MSRNVRQANGLDRYRSYDRPPEGFDPLTAPDELLLRHGLPRRPDQTGSRSLRGSGNAHSPARSGTRRPTSRSTRG